MKVQDLLNCCLYCFPSHDKDSAFRGALVYLTHVGEDKVRGIIINRSSDRKIKSLMQQVGISPGPLFKNHDILFGGPVSREQLFLLFKDKHAGGLNIRYAATVDDLQYIASFHEQLDYVAAIGECVWTPEQILQEVQHSNWLVLPAKQELLFESKCEERVNLFLSELGISVEQITSDKGWA